MKRFSHGRYWDHSWPGCDEPPDKPLWRVWLAAIIGCWGAVALVAAGIIYGLPWLVDLVTP
jgi:hypothetical protein